MKLSVIGLLPLLWVGSAAAQPAVKFTVAPSEPALKREALPPAARVDKANRAAAREPATENYLNAIQTYPYMEGALFRIYAAPERVTDLMLEPGENLVAISAGDTARWIIGNTQSGEGETARSHILLKPHVSGLKTNLILTTNRRAYHLQLESTPSTYMAAVAWRYPELPLVKVTPSVSPPAAASDQALPLANLNFDYILEGDTPAWTPLRVFDDSKKTYIAFPAALATNAAPAFYVTGADGKPQLVNYRQSAGYFVIDRLFEGGELRAGTHPQTVVRIRRAAPGWAAVSDRKGRRHD